MDASPRISRDEVEQAVASAWAAALGLPAVRAHDDFFDLGGHSLIAIEMMAQIRALTGVDVTVSDLYRASTVAALADEILRAIDEAGAAGETA